jgi:hypothetical protein
MQTRMFRKIKKGEYKFHSPMWDDVSEEAKVRFAYLFKSMLPDNGTSRCVTRTGRHGLCKLWWVSKGP